MEKRDLPLTRVVRDFEFCKRSENWSEKTIRWYSHTLKLFLEWLETEHHLQRLGDVDVPLIREYIVHLQTKKKWEGNPYVPTKDERLSDESVHTHVRALRSFFHWLEKEGYLEEHLMRGVQIRKPKAGVLDVLGEADFQQIYAKLNINSSRGARAWTIITMLADAGLRASELLGLKLEDLHLHPRGSWVKVAGKGGKERIVPLGTKSQRALARYIETFRPEQLDGDNRVFLTEEGKPLSYDGLKSWFHRLSKTVGVRLYAHLLRHTYATNYLLNGCGDVFTLQENLGHTSLEMSRRYAHLARRHEEAAKRRPGPMDSMDIRKGRKPNKGKR